MARSAGSAVTARTCSRTASSAPRGRHSENSTMIPTSSVLRSSSERATGTRPPGMRPSRRSNRGCCRSSLNRDGTRSPCIWATPIPITSRPGSTCGPSSKPCPLPASFRRPLSTRCPSTCPVGSCSGIPISSRCRISIEPTISSCSAPIPTNRTEVSPRRPTGPSGWRRSVGAAARWWWSTRGARRPPTRLTSTLPYDPAPMRRSSLPSSTCCPPIA